MELPLYYVDKNLAVIQKPSGLFVHPSEFSPREDSVMKILRNQLGVWVYPVHRLDRATSGVMVLALNPETANQLVTQFTERSIKKKYHAIVRGQFTGSRELDWPLAKEGDGVMQDAVTHFRGLMQSEHPVANRKFGTSRYSLIEAIPLTGRMHQIRRHLTHLRFPIVGDATYGDNTHNRIAKEYFESFRLMLFSRELSFAHPDTGDEMSFLAEGDLDYQISVEKYFSTLL